MPPASVDSRDASRSDVESDCLSARLKRARRLPKGPTRRDSSFCWRGSSFRGRRCESRSLEPGFLPAKRARRSSLLATEGAGFRAFTLFRPAPATARFGRLRVSDLEDCERSDTGASPGPSSNVSLPGQEPLPPNTLDPRRPLPLSSGSKYSSSSMYSGSLSPRYDMRRNRSTWERAPFNRQARGRHINQHSIEPNIGRLSLEQIFVRQLCAAPARRVG